MLHQFMNHNEFEFDRVFDEFADNAEVYAQSAQVLVSKALEGGFSTCMVYGQTGRSPSKPVRIRIAASFHRILIFRKWENVYDDVDLPQRRCGLVCTTRCFDPSIYCEPSDSVCVLLRGRRRRLQRSVECLPPHSIGTILLSPLFSLLFLLSSTSLLLLLHLHLHLHLLPLFPSSYLHCIILVDRL